MTKIAADEQSIRGTRMRRSLRRIPALRRAMLSAIMAITATTAFAGDSPAAWIGTWATAPQSPFPGPVDRYQNVTLRLIVHTTVGGTRVRIRLSNTHGRTPLRIAVAHIARRASGADIEAASDRVLSFGGHPDVVVAPGETIVSDPTSLDVPALSDLAVSLFAAARVDATTVHALAQQTSYVSGTHGDVTGAEHLSGAHPIDNWPFLTGVDVEVQRGAAVVVFGDSLVDGDGTTADANTRWTDALARRLQKAGGQLAQISVLNEGLIGNRLLYGSQTRHAAHIPDFGEALGESGVDRFERDVLRQPGVRAVIIHLATNDIGFDAMVAPAGQKATLDSLIAGYRVLIARAHQAGLRVFGTTLTPVEGETVLPGYFTPAKEALRGQVNEWIRHSGEFDAVIDLDAVLRDPRHPAQLSAPLASHDHLHPNDAGYAAAAADVPLDLFDGLVRDH